jgi:hypothetical protein
VYQKLAPYATEMQKIKQVMIIVLEAIIESEVINNINWLILE